MMFSIFLEQSSPKHFFCSSRRRHTRSKRDWSSDVCSSDLRGGVGLFSGSPPYIWVGNAYRDDGTEQLFLSCDGSAVPPFDPLNQPTACASGAGPVPQLSFFDPGLSFPQNLKVALGADHRLPGGVVGTVDVLYAEAAHQWYVNDANLGPPVGV